VDLPEQNLWTCLSAPVMQGGSGDRTFYVDQTGVIREDGPDGPPIGANGAS
jgi:hypothetical protein